MTKTTTSFWHGLLPLLLTLAALHTSSVHARVYEGTSPKKFGSFGFLGRFAYEATSVGETAKLKLDVTSHAELLALYDSQELWDQAEKLETCFEKIALATHRYPFAESSIVQDVELSVAENSYWFLAVADCSKEEVTVEEHRIEFLQANLSQYSLEEYGLLTLFGIYFVVYIVIVAIQLYGMWVLSRSVQVHPMFIVFSTSLMFQFVGVLFIMVHWAKYGNNGIGYPGSLGFGEFCEFLSEVFFFSLVLLIGRGWTITFKSIQQKYFVFGILFSYIVLYLAFFIYVSVTRDSASTESEWNTIPAILLLTLRSLTWLYFLYSLRVAYRLEISPEKLQFYRLFGPIYSFWLLLWPLFVAFCAAADSTVSNKVLTILFETLTIVAFAIMAYVLWPSKVYQIFRNPSDFDQLTGGVKDAGNLPYTTIA